MRVALLADIHANIAALDAVLAAASAAGVDAYCIAGDLVGYYYQPRAVLERLAEIDCWVVRGNHDDMLLAAHRDAGQLGSYRAKYGSGVDRALEQLDAAEIAWLGRLPRMQVLDVGGRTLMLAHGAPWDTDEYLYPDAADEKWSRVAGYGCDFAVLGHTHYPLARTQGGTLIVNPGSVGQPRNRRPGAAWALLDTETGRVEQRSEAYDIASLAAEAASTDRHLPFLAEVLTRT